MCVSQLSESTRTHLITDKAGGHIPDDEHKSNKLSQKEETFISLYMTIVWTENTGMENVEIWLNGHALDHVFIRHFEIALHIGSKTCLDQIKLYGSIAHVSRVRICIVG